MKSDPIDEAIPVLRNMAVAQSDVRATQGLLD